MSIFQNEIESTRPDLSIVKLRVWSPGRIIDVGFVPICQEGPDGGEYCHGSNQETAQMKRHACDTVSDVTLVCP